MYLSQVVYTRVYRVVYMPPYYATRVCTMVYTPSIPPRVYHRPSMLPAYYRPYTLLPADDALGSNPKNTLGERLSGASRVHSC